MCSQATYLKSICYELIKDLSQQLYLLCCRFRNLLKTTHGDYTGRFTGRFGNCECIQDTYLIFWLRMSTIRVFYEGPTRLSKTENLLSNVTTGIKMWRKWLQGNRRVADSGLKGKQELYKYKCMCGKIPLASQCGLCNVFRSWYCWVFSYKSSSIILMYSLNKEVIITQS